MPASAAVYGAPPLAAQSGPKGSKGGVDVGPPSFDRGSVPNASQALASLRSGFRYCYGRGLSTDPKMEGRLTLNMKLTPTGTVQGVEMRPEKTLPPPTRACIAERAQNARFDAPQGGTTVLTVTVTFKQGE